MLARVLLAVLALTACERAEALVTRTVDAAGTDVRSDAAYDGTTEWDACGDRPSPRPGVSYIPDGSMPPAAEEAPSISCVNEPGPCGEPPCEPPPSRCVDSRWLMYWTDGACIEGRCSWKQQVYFCALACTSDGCQSKGTTK